MFCLAVVDAVHVCLFAGQARATIEEEPTEELGCSSEAEPICQDCTPPGAPAPGMFCQLLCVAVHVMDAVSWGPGITLQADWLDIPFTS